MAIGLNIVRSHGPIRVTACYPSMANRSPRPTVTPAMALRAQARRIRSYAHNFSDDKVADRLQKYAAELEERAKVLEQQHRSSKV
jgi:hypothetical protein